MEQWSTVTLAGVTWQSLKCFHQQALLTVCWQCCSPPIRLCVYSSMSPVTTEPKPTGLLHLSYSCFFPSPPSPSALVLLVLFPFSCFFSPSSHSRRYCNDRHGWGCMLAHQLCSQSRSFLPSIEMESIWDEKFWVGLNNKITLTVEAGREENPREEVFHRWSMWKTENRLSYQEKFASGFVKGQCRLELWIISVIYRDIVVVLNAACLRPKEILRTYKETNLSCLLILRNL